MLAYKFQTPGNYPEESTQHSEHGESLKLKQKVVRFAYRKDVGWGGEGGGVDVKLHSALIDHLPRNVQKGSGTHRASY